MVDDSASHCSSNHPRLPAFVAKATVPLSPPLRPTNSWPPFPVTMLEIVARVMRTVGEAVSTGPLSSRWDSVWWSSARLLAGERHSAPV